MAAAAAVGRLVVAAVAAAAVQAAAVTATSSAGEPAGLERRLRLSTQAARLRLSCARLRAFARRFRGMRGLLVGEGCYDLTSLNYDFHDKSLSTFLLKILAKKNVYKFGAEQYHSSRKK